MTDSYHVADLLAEADIAPIFEKMQESERAKGKGDSAQRAELAQRKGALVARFAAVMGKNRLELMARDIDEQRVVYEFAVKARPDDPKLRRRLREAATTFQRLLRKEIETDWWSGVDLLKEHRELLDGLARFRLEPAPELAKPWHGCATKLAASYLIILRPVLRGWSPDGQPVCFVQKALERIGAGTRSRPNIVKVIRAAGL
jgi:hypothetical protein